MDKKIIDVEATRTDSHGNGYYRGSDGRYYYGNTANGYLTETLEEQRKKNRQAFLKQEEQRKKTWAQEEQRKAQLKQEMYAAPATNTGAVGSGLEILFVTVSFGAMMATVLYILLVIGVAFSITLLWPEYIRTLIWSYGYAFSASAYQFQAVLAALLRTIHFCGMICLFVRCFCATAPERQTFGGVSFFAKASVIFTAVMLTLIDLVSGNFFLLGSILGGLFMGVGYTILPALVLHYREYRLSGQKRFIRHMAEVICGTTPGHGLVFKILGGLTAAAAGLGFLSGSDLSFQVTMILITIATFYIGIAGNS